MASLYSVHTLSLVYVHGPTVAFQTPHVISTVEMDWKLSHSVSNCELWRLAFQGSQSDLICKNS